MISFRETSKVMTLIWKDFTRQRFIYLMWIRISNDNFIYNSLHVPEKKQCS